ncbi:MAG TPA: FtsX-like permease family protein, partial [Candidatus Thermoplasmatota archaeon]|nr:FtsX-like permease family protein [Candidatus Thermoplasmatota archaeon]
VRALAGRHGWGTEGAPAFAQRYLGEVVGLVRGLALALAVLFLTLPVFLVWHGTSQQLAFHQRELAVARAIGIGPRTVAAALALQAGLTFLAALGMALAAVLLVAASHGRLMQGAGSIPVPVAFHLTASDVALAVAATAAAILLAIAFAMVHHARRDVASDLRAG